MKTILVTHKKLGNKFALVDDEDFEILSKYNWYLSPRQKTNYAITYIGMYKNCTMHRMIIKTKKWVDHRDGDGLNNQKTNLRESTVSQNTANSLNHKVGNCGFKGVRYKDTHKKFAANCKKNGKTYFGGHFDTAIEAAMAYNELAKIHHGEFAVLNNI